MRTIAALTEDVAGEARRAEFPVDTPAYEKASRDPLSPILFAGALGAPICVLGRDLGKDEVMVGQPLVGAAGRLVRAGVYQASHGTPPPRSDKTLESVLDQVLLTNTVPYKPPGNKAYAPAVKERFRPYLAELIVAHWQGYHVITLGTEAFQWFAPYFDAGTFAAFWERDDRYEAELRCVLTATVAMPGARSTLHKSLTIMPLPHPSPLNRRWYKQFPGLLARRLAAIGLALTRAVSGLASALICPCSTGDGGTYASQGSNPRSLGLPIAKLGVTLRNVYRSFSLVRKENPVRRVQMVTDRELEILKILWVHGRASVREVQDDLNKSTGPVAYSTVQTLLNIMEEKKGLVRHVVEGRTFIYIPKKSSDRTIRELTRRFVDRVFDGCLDRVMVALLDSKSPTPAEFDRLRAMIDQAQRQTAAAAAAEGASADAG